jgi:hypothetical protein
LILTVKIPSRFDVTVRAKANAVLAPASWVREIPLVRVVGTQQKIANPAVEPPTIIVEYYFFVLVHSDSRFHGMEGRAVFAHIHNC